MKHGLIIIFYYYSHRLPVPPDVKLLRKLRLLHRRATKVVSIAVVSESRDDEASSSIFLRSV